MARSPHLGPHRVRVSSEARDGDGQERRFLPEAGSSMSDGTFSVVLGTRDSGPPLRPATPYRFTVEHEVSGALVGEGRFRTAPVPGSREAGTTVLGVASCHLPFDQDGSYKPSALRTLRVATAALEGAGVHRLLLVGDQIYTDHPPALSFFEADYFAQVAPPGRQGLLECSSAEIRRLYQDRYRSFWRPPSLRRLQASFATLPAIDDHEIVDNFGTHPDHQTSAWRRVREGALAAFHDYQARRVFGESRPPSFDYGVRHGDVALYVLDLRTERRAGADGMRVLSDAQLGRLTRFLGEHRDAGAAVIVLSVPLMGLPGWLLRAAGMLATPGSNLMDRWEVDPARSGRDALLRSVAAHAERAPRQRIVLVGGDLHIGLAHEMRLPGSDRTALQLVSSPVSNTLDRLPPRAVSTAMRMADRVRATLIPGRPPADQNPFCDLNLGVVEVDSTGAEVGVRLRLISHDPGDLSRPRTVYDSGFI
ncbi:MAG: alkaline phosphatase D family protein [Sandaracinaceae bacterium]